MGINKALSTSCFSALYEPFEEPEGELEHEVKKWPGNFGCLLDLKESEKNKAFTSAGDDKFRAIARTQENPLQIEEGKRKKRMQSRRVVSPEQWEGETEMLKLMCGVRNA